MRSDRRRFLKAATASLAAAAVPAGAAASPKGALRPIGDWRTLADMPFPVQEVYPSIFVRNGAPLIVNAGGLAVGLTRPIKIATTIYDPAADAWTRGVDLPEARHHLALAFVDGAGLFAVGGFRRTGLDVWTAQTDVWRIEDPATGRWESAAPLPAPRGEAVTVALGGRIHMIGGRSPSGGTAGPNRKWTDQEDVATHLVYDPQADVWESRAPLPGARNSAAGSVLNGEIHVVSGRTVSGGNTPVCHAYDPAADRWREIAPLPEPRRQPAPRGQGGLAGATFGGRLYVFGGEWFGNQGFGDGGVYADSWGYDPATDVWRALAPMTRPRHGLGGVAIESRGDIDGVYAIGGAARPGGDGVTPFLDRFDI